MSEQEMTADELQQIEERVAKATKAPLEVGIADPNKEDSDFYREFLSPGGDTTHLVWAPEDPRTRIGADRYRPEFVIVVAITGNGPTAEANAEFIAAARSDVPRLVAEVRRLTEQVDSITAHAIDVFACGTCDRHGEHIRSLSFADFYAAESGRGCTYCDTERLAKREEEVTRLRVALTRIATFAATPTANWTAADVARQALEASS